MTLTRNVIGLLTKGGKSGPSADLIRYARSALAADKIRADRDKRLEGAANAVAQARNSVVS